MSEERLQRILARAGLASRRKAEELIREGRVTVNGELAEIGTKADPERDAIKLDGKRVQPHTGGFHYLLLNKPKAVMSTVNDPEDRPTVMDYVPVTLRKALVPVGRLDFHTEGLLILTDDGDFAQHVAHPRYGGVKVYEVKVKGRPTEQQLERLRAGVAIDGRRTYPCRISPRYGDGSVEKRRARARAAEEKEGENSWWTVELTEGRTRQIREMFYRIGHGVLKLRRIAIGPLRDSDLPLGAVRELTEAEVEKLRKATSRKKTAPGAAAAPTVKKASAAKPGAPRAFPAPGTKKVDRSRPWRAEKVKAAPPAAAPETPKKPAKKAAKPATGSARPSSVRRASGRPAMGPARKTSGRPPAAKKAAGRPKGKPAGRASGPRGTRRTGAHKPGGGPRRGR